MKIIDEKGKLFGLVNIVDLTVLLVIVIAVGGIGYKVANKAKTDSGKQIEVVLRAQNVYTDTDKSIAVGDKLVASSAYQNAEVSSVEVKPASYIGEKSDGTPVLSNHPFRKDLRITVKGKADVVGPSIKFAGQDLNVEKEFIFKTQKVELKVYPESIEIK